MKRAAMLAIAVLLLTAATHRRAVSPPAQPEVNIIIPRSLVITDPDVISGFTLQRVLQALIARAGVQQTPLQLYQQWFDTQNPKPGLVVADAPHCDDFITDGKPSFNGFMRRCPTPEGALAITDPFTSNDYTPIGITNRFDQTPADGSNCGQYRIVFTHRISDADHIEIIFEGVLPNPNRSAGITACRPVAQFWADLGNIDSASERRTRIEQFFFDGIPGFAPLLAPENFDNGGRVRNKHVSSAAHNGVPRFYQFLVQKRCTDGNCRLIMQPDVLENVPFGPLYDASVDSARSAAFRAEVIRNLPTLALRDINYYVNFPKDYLMAESDPTDTFFADAAGPAYAKGLSSQAGKDFDAQVRAELQRIGSTLTPNNIMNRLDLQNCDGCHRGGSNLGEGVVFPLGLLDSHIVRGGISPALRDVFAPNRAKVLHDFLVFGTPPPAHVN